jgi:hypothetical protein
MAISTPQPSVVHLVTLFRQISAGDIRVPAFQREFVWKEKQVLELLESVAEGYPIGSILLWNVDTKMLRIAPTEATSFPSVEEKFPTNYVLDGMQRLSTLYGVFHFGISTQDPIFDVSYDLGANAFFHSSEADFSSGHTVPLAALFSPKQLLSHQAKLAALTDGDVLIDRLIALQGSFQEYMIPVVSIRSTDVHRIVGMFEKINSTGTRLDPVDFMRAITWAEDFDLNHHLEEAVETLSAYGFSLDPETIVKCVGLTLNIPPTTVGLLDLRKRNPQDLRKGFQKAKDGLARVSSFAAERLWIYSSQCIPYEGQLLLLFKAIGMQQAEDDDIERIVNWFWASGFNESLRGKPDHYVVRAIDKWRALVQGGVRGLEPRLKLAEAELFERRLVSGGALSTTFMAMHAANCARHLENGNLIEPASYMDSADTSCFESVFGRPDLIAANMPDTISARLFGNVVLIDKSRMHGRSSPPIKQWILRAAEQNDWDVLASQFIDRSAAEALEIDDPKGFMSSRVRLMKSKAESLVRGVQRS